jgi:hypothetical protein
MLDSVALAMVLTCTIYMCVGFMSIALFGHGVSSNILLDIGQLGTLSLMMRGVFLVVIICHVPYTFFCAKEAACILADEVINNSLTKSISESREKSSIGKAKVEAQIIKDMSD